MKLLHLTDLHLYGDREGAKRGFRTWASLDRVLEHTLSDPRWPPDRILLGGDHTEDEREASYRMLRRALDGLGRPWTAVLGNHDVPEYQETHLDSGTGPRVEELDEAWSLLCLDSRREGHIGGRLGAGTLARLEDVLQDLAHRHVLLMIHHPPMDIGTPWLDRLGLEDGEALLAVLRRHRAVRAVLCGHVHQGLELVHEGLALLTTPSTCYQFLPGAESFALDDRPPGCRWMELHADGCFDTEVVWAAPAAELEAARAAVPSAHG